MTGCVPGADRGEQRSFVRHYIEMVLAMFAGMAIGGVLVSMFCSLTGHQGLFDHPGATAPLMATNMTVGMAVWMRHRGHAWLPVGEMALAMYAPLVLLAAPYALGAFPGGVLLAAMHVVMFVAMWAAMAHRPGEYVRPHRGGGRFVPVH